MFDVPSTKDCFHIVFLSIGDFCKQRANLCAVHGFPIFVYCGRRRRQNKLVFRAQRANLEKNNCDYQVRNCLHEACKRLHYNQL